MHKKIFEFPKCLIFFLCSFYKFYSISGQDRQIQPLSCSSQTTGEVGVCMFAWNCVEAGGHHLGTCIDRFYFGSCCKLPDVIATNELGPGQAPEGIVPVNLDDGLGGLDVGHKPQVDAPADVIGNSNLLLSSHKKHYIKCSFIR